MGVLDSYRHDRLNGGEAQERMMTESYSISSIKPGGYAHRMANTGYANKPIYPWTTTQTPC